MKSYRVKVFLFVEAGSATEAETMTHAIIKEFVEEKNFKVRKGSAKSVGEGETK